MMRRLTWVVLAGGSAWAVAGPATGGCVAEQSECERDKDCDDDEECDDGECVDASGGQGGTPNVGGAGTGGTGTVVPPTPQEVCQRYLDCLAAVAPDEVAAAFPMYGPDGSCWQGDPQTEQMCATACRSGLAEWHASDPEVAACYECVGSGDCVSPTPHCDQGSCVGCVDDTHCPIGMRCLEVDGAPVCSSCAAEPELCCERTCDLSEGLPCDSEVDREMCRSNLCWQIGDADPTCQSLAAAAFDCALDHEAPLTCHFDHPYVGVCVCDAELTALESTCEVYVQRLPCQ